MLIHSLSNLNFSALAWLACSWVVVGFAGCGEPREPQFRANQVEWLKQERINLGDGEDFPESIKQEVDSIMTSMFGSPDHAKFPFTKTSNSDSETPSIEKSLLPLEALRMAAGAVASDRDGKHQGLFREHCATCHGLAGDGAGAYAAILDPYPRDFRMGKFKFKSTPQRQPPTDDDLRSVLVKGIPGTGMPSFQKLNDEDIDALIVYVKYLAIRGQFERYLLNEVPSLLDDSFFENSDQRESYLALSESTSTQTANPKESTASLGNRKLQKFLIDQYSESFGDQFMEFVVDRWTHVEEFEKQNPLGDAPAWLDREHPDHPRYLKLGEELFLGKGTCYQCHGKDGKGQGTLAGYDAWTDDWIKSPGVDVNDKSTYSDFLKAGAQRPQLSRPRNLHLGIYRGGGDELSLYRRIAFGIEGSPMPPAAALTPDEVWSLVAFIQSLPGSNALLGATE